MELWKLRRKAESFWRTKVDNAGVLLTLRDASPVMRDALLDGYELDDAELARSVLQPGDRVLELGSSIGFMALYCRTRLGITDYAMVEANPRLEPLVRENFRLNRAGDPMLFIAAAGPADGEVTFGVNRDFWSSSVLSRENEAETITVPQRSIPSLIAELPFDPNVLIIDIEGGETRIPIEHWLHFDKIVVEFHERLVGEEPIMAIRDSLRIAGFAEAGSNNFSRAYVRKGGNA